MASYKSPQSATTDKIFLPPFSHTLKHGHVRTPIMSPCLISMHKVRPAWRRDRWRKLARAGIILRLPLVEGRSDIETEDTRVETNVFNHHRLPFRWLLDLETLGTTRPEQQHTRSFCIGMKRNSGAVWDMGLSDRARWSLLRSLEY
ncbi:hypothetical protein AVEN_238720-1 [Araneus ventricosus]|uniref:Uncharacterized protein n=1 Tax=Araneus ventricosus TaxID=182803 RepID=A0A4Y2GIZ4_ARAVE|nr:hypothetical protein AVEN_238720-1 [Araneus ventricosus]